MQLSAKARDELRIILRKIYGEGFERALPDEDVDYLGAFFLEITAQGLKLRMQEAHS